MKNIYTCKACGGLAPLGVGYAGRGTAEQRAECSRRNRCDCGWSTRRPGHPDA